MRQDAPNAGRKKRILSHVQKRLVRLLVWLFTNLMLGTFFFRYTNEMWVSQPFSVLR